MAGAGLTANNVTRIIQQTGVRKSTYQVKAYGPVTCSSNRCRKNGPSGRG
ncbi:hypothetical protein ACT691_16785 [Vibrio metschnikovii]